MHAGMRCPTPHVLIAINVWTTYYVLPCHPNVQNFLKEWLHEIKTSRDLHMVGIGQHFHQVFILYPSRGSLVAQIVKTLLIPEP